MPALPDYKIPKTCKACVVVNEGPDFSVEVVDVPVPEPGPDEVLLKLNITGLCSSDISFMKGDIGLPPMSASSVRSPGHEGAGVVVKVGSNVKHVKVGDRGGIKPIWDTCGSCSMCWSQRDMYCSGITFSGLHVPGTYQQYVVSPARYMSPIPQGVPDELAAPIMCSASTVFRSILESGLIPGDWAVFPGGGGGVGIQGVQVAKAMGLRPIAIDTGADKRDLCLRMGAEQFIDFREESDVAAAVVKAADGIGAHGVFVTATPAYKDAISYTGTRVGAKVMCIGLPPFGTSVLGADPCLFVYRNLELKGTLVGSMQDTHRCLELAGRGLLNPIIAERYPVSRFPEAVMRLKKGLVSGRVIIDYNMED